MGSKDGPMAKEADYFKMAFEGALPADFDGWGIPDNRNGMTVAHQAAVSGLFPKGFDRWELVGWNGRPVAHFAALLGHLPKDFDRWELRDGDGWTVAHVAAYRGTLPDNFDRWELADHDGRTVAEYKAARDRRIKR